jgi:hypothetical protein
MEEASDRSFPLLSKNRRRRGQCPEGATEHRLETYAPLALRTVERSPKAIPGAIAVRYSITPLLRYSITPFLHSFAGNVLYPFLQHLQVLR